MWSSIYRNKILISTHAVELLLVASRLFEREISEENLWSSFE